MEISSNDRRIIAVLQANARISISDLARQLNLSRTTVQNRFNWLEQSGVISGYSLRLSDSFRSKSLQAYVNLEVEPKSMVAVVSALEKLAAVESLYSVSGKIDFVAIVRVDSPAELDAALDLIGALSGVKATNSAIVLSTKFNRR